MAPKRIKAFSRKRPASVAKILRKYNLPPDFALSPHVPTGRWYKKIRGRRHYFGKLDDPQTALEAYLDTKDDLLAGRTPVRRADVLTVKGLVNDFLDSKKRSVLAGELQPATWDWYRESGRQIASSLGRLTPVESLVPKDFALLRAELAKQYGPRELGKKIQATRSIFKYGAEAGLVEKVILFGPEFKKPAEKMLRKVRQDKPKRLLSAVEIRKLLECAGAPMRAMALLGVNAGFGNTDVASLPRAALDLAAGFVEFPRPKTFIERRAALWPETVRAIEVALQIRPDPLEPEDDRLVFLTTRGKRWVYYDEGQDGKRGRCVDTVSQKFGRVLTELGIKRSGVSFYALRHVFQTVAEGTGDLPTVKRVMGHADQSMASHYREEIEDDRLREVARLVRNWLEPWKLNAEGVVAKIG